MTTQVVDVSDILRSQIVLAVSAIDHLIHELARLGVTEVADGTRPKCDAWSRCEIGLQYVELALAAAPSTQWLGEAVREKHSWQSFQHPDRIADAIRLFSTVSLWQEVGNKLSTNASDVKTRLRAIVDRRNKIAHEADIDPANPGFRWAIDTTMVDQSVTFIESVGDAIYDAIK